MCDDSDIAIAEWVAEARETITRFRREGLLNQAADVAGYVEKKVLGVTLKRRQQIWEKAEKMALCSVRDCPFHRYKGKRFCKGHQPKFDFVN